MEIFLWNLWSRSSRHMNLGVHMFNVDVVQDPSSQGKKQIINIDPYL